MNEAPGRRNSARLWRIAGGIVIGLLILAALLLGALRLAVARVPEYAGRIQGWIERQTDLRVEFTGLDARLRWYGPEIVLRGVRVLDRDGTQALFATREGTVALDAWNFFRTGELVAGRIRFLGPAVTVVRLADGRIRLLGQRERPADRPPFDLDRLPAGRVEIEDATVTYRDLKTGRGPWTLEKLSLALQRERDHVNAAGSARLPASLGAAVTFDGRLRGSLDRFAELDARVGLRADRLLLAGLTDFLPPQVARPLAGEGPVGVVVSVSHGRLDEARLTVDLEDVALQLPRRVLPTVETVEISVPYREPGASPLSLSVLDKTVIDRPATPLPREIRYPGLTGDFRLQRTGETWSFRAQDVRITPRAGHPPVPSTLAFSWRGNPKTTYGLSTYVSRLQLEDAWPLVLALAPSAFDRWAGLAPSGEIRGLRAEVVRERAGAVPRFAFSANVAGLGFRATGRLPGVSGMTAAVSGTDERGRIGLRAQGLAFDWPRQFREPIAGLRAEGDVDWRRDGNAWVLSARSVQLTHPQAQARASFDFTFERPAVSPLLTLDATVDWLDVALVRRVLPVGRLKPRSLAWLDRAFVQGRAENGHLRYSGPVRKFPFRGGEGEFAASADVSGVTLDYFEGFTPLTGAAGTVAFRNAGLEATVREGRAGGLRLQGATVSIADLKESVIDVDAGASGDIGQALTFLQGSPLGPRLGRQFMQLSGQGPADYAVRFHIPTQDIASRDYDVRATLRSVTVALPALRAPAHRVTGEFELHNLEARSRSLRGTILDGPFELSVEPGPVNKVTSASVLLRGQGRAAGPRLPAFIGLPDSIRMSGTADWVFDGRLERRAAAEPWSLGFAVSSDLQGLRIDAPRPFAKEPAVARPTRVTLDIGRAGRNEVGVESGSARARLAFLEGGTGRWDLERGAARFDGRPAVLPERKGLVVAGDWPEFDLGEWLALRSSGSSGRRLSDWLGPADVHLDRALVFGFELRDVFARLQPQPAAWQVTLAGPMAEGQITVPANLDGGTPIRLDMRRLQLVAAQRAASETGERAVDPRTLPALSITADDFSWQARRFGKFSAEIRKDPQGLRVARLESTSPDFNLSGSGSWLAEGSGSRTRLDLEFSSGDLAAASRALGYRDSVQAKQARARASVTWLGGPSEDAIGRMDGTLRLELGNGQLRTVKPGAGRILGLMSVGDLPRRLALDFRDVTDEGLAFDTVSGDFELRAGDAYTQNLLVKGPAVDIGVVGRTGLLKQDYDQTVVVSGNPTGPLTVAGALAGGPVGAAGVLLFSQLFKGQLQGLTRVYYRVTGPWSSPVVERISAQSSENVVGRNVPESGAVQ